MCLCSRFAQLSGRGMQANKVCVAVARELAPFVQAIAQQATLSAQRHAQKPAPLARGDAHGHDGKNPRRHHPQPFRGQSGPLEQRGSFHDGQRTDTSLVHSSQSHTGTAPPALLVKHFSHENDSHHY